MHLNYDSFPHQFILYQDYQRRCYKVPLLKPEQKYYSEEPFLCYVLRIITVPKKLQP